MVFGVACAEGKPPLGAVRAIKELSAGEAPDNQIIEDLAKDFSAQFLGMDEEQLKDQWHQLHVTRMESQKVFH